MKSKRISVYLYNQKQVSNFINSNALKQLAENFELRIYAVGDILSKLPSSVENISTGEINKLVHRLSVLRLNSVLWREKNRTMGHYMRAMNLLGNRKQRHAHVHVIKYDYSPLNFLKSFIIKVVSRQPYSMGLSLLEDIARNALRKTTWREIFKGSDLVIVPYGGYISPHFGLAIYLAKKLNVPTLAIQENWDNLSSKCFILDEPNYFGVWGEQSASHLKSIHRLDLCEISILGSPRSKGPVDAELINSDPVIRDNYGTRVAITEPFLLVTGTGDGIDDEMLLNECSLALQAIHNADLLIIYRPHPYARTQQNFESIYLAHPNLLIDFSDQFGDEELTHLLGKAKLVVNHFSTLTLESLMVGTPVCLPTYLGRPAKYQYDRFINETQHYIGVKLIDGLEAPRSFHDLIQVFEKHLSTPIKYKVSSNVNWLCHRGDFALEISTLVNRIISAK